jgi:TatD DNase family protein
MAGKREHTPVPEAVLPALGESIADTHAHLDMLDDPAGALERAALAGVTMIATIADLSEEPELTLDGLASWREEAGSRLRARGAGETSPDVRVIVGVHPHNAKHYDDATDAALRARTADARVCAIGEVGLDYHYDHSPRDAQLSAMRRHLAAAHEAGLPVCVHLREAHEEGLAVLLEAGVPAAGCIIHCFTEGPAWAERFLEIGCHIAFGGVVTFPKAAEVRAAVRMMPLDRLLVETDCPFLAPVPYRGRTCEPAFVTLTAARIAEVRGVDPATVARATLDNARRLFPARHGEERVP